MGRKGGMTLADYSAELDKQHWALYKTFYLEAKRKVKLTISEYNNCAKAKEDLQQTDQLPTTEAAVRSWDRARLITDPVSDQQLETAFYSIKFACNSAVPISDPDKVRIKGYLDVYFNSDPKNFFRLIFKKDLVSPPNANLQSINTILASYSCNLTNVAVDDPAICLKERRIFTDSTPC